MPKKKKVNLTYLVNFSCKSYFLDYVRFHQWFFSVLVKLRIVVLLPSLKPYSGQFNVEIIVRVVFILSIFLTFNFFLQRFESKTYIFLSKDGKNKTVQQWLDVRGKKGVYSKTFPIPRDSNHGQWRIVVENLVI